ncbi:MAG TPA: tetratricopeptide repeat protein [Bryobacteraceae bacterium]|nr:tetratricopeptide repeat protein [Bryobacteraceae bacterium]
MKDSRRSTRAEGAARPRRTTPAAPSAAPPPRIRIWPYLLGALLAVFLAFEIYQPAIRGPFLYDDRYLPFFAPEFASAPLWNWIAGVRPALMLSYWANFQLVQLDPYWYHVVNVFFHAGNAILVWLIALKILEWAGVPKTQRAVLAIFSGLLFLLHPLQTESVAYVASRSETQSLFFFLAAFAVFLYRPSPAVSWPVATAVLILFAAACLTKEHAAVLPALLILTDYFWNPGFNLAGIRRNWRLYLPVSALGAVGAAVIWRVLATSTSAGFGMKDLPWRQYFFTQCRAIWTYLRMIALPYGQNIDHDFPISRTVFDHGALFGLIALAAVTIAAWVWRKRFPLAAYGWFVFLLLLAPTSSIIPIQDVLVERRVYLPFFGVTLICCELLRRAPLGRPAPVAALAAILLALGVVARQRNEVWSNAISLWKDATAKSPNKSRPHFQLAFAYYSEGRCLDAVKEYQRTSELDNKDDRLYIDWALAYDCAKQPEAALEKLRRATSISKTGLAYSLIGMVYAKQNRRAEALEALDQAERLDPNLEATYVNRGNLYLLSQEFDKAASQFRRALELNPADAIARNGLDMAQRRQAPAPPAL